MNNTFIGIIIALIIGSGIVIYFAADNSSIESILPDVEIGTVEASDILQVRPDDVIQGIPNSPVVLIEFADFECPACAAYHPLIKEVISIYGNHVTFVSRHFPLIRIHPNAVYAARAAEAAGKQNQYHEMADLIFTHQEDWRTNRGGISVFTPYAEQLGLNIDQFIADGNSEEIAIRVETQRQEAEAINVSSTPSFFLNGEQISGMQTIKDFADLFNPILGIEPVVETTEPTDAAETTETDTDEAQ